MRKIKYKYAPVVLFALFIIYLIALFRITIFRNSNSWARSANLIPFTTIAEYLRSTLRGDMIVGISNLAGNLILFLPLGYMTALLLPKMRRLTKALALAVTFSLIIEALQYILACGAADIDDVILNTLGGVAGYWLYVFIAKYSNPKKYAILISASMITLTCAGFFAFDSYRFLLPMAGNLPARAERFNKVISDPFTVDEPPGGHLSINTIADIDSAAGSAYDARSDTGETAWQLVFVNKWNIITDDYEVELIGLANGISVDKRIYPALQDMFDTARSDGVYPVVVSGYRTAEEQQSLLDKKIADYKAGGLSDEDAITEAEAWVAVPGASEHQLGIAVDVNADGINSTGQEVYEWLDQNSYKFGFVRRYPAGKTEITGVINEPWHYRYVGVDAAAEMYNQGICLEEYLGKINGDETDTGGKRMAQNTARSLSHAK